MTDEKLPSGQTVVGGVNIISETVNIYVSDSFGRDGRDGLSGFDGLASLLRGLLQQLAEEKQGR